MLTLCLIFFLHFAKLLQLSLVLSGVEDTVWAVTLLLFCTALLLLYNRMRS